MIYAIRKDPHQNSAQSHGNLRAFQSPTADQIAAKINAHLLAHLSLIYCIICKYNSSVMFIDYGDFFKGKVIKNLKKKQKACQEAFQS